MRRHLKRVLESVVVASLLTSINTEAALLQYRVPITPAASTGSTGTLTASSSAIYFDAQQVNYGRASQKVTLTNTGTHKLTVAGVLVDDANFEVSSGCNQRLLVPSGSCQVDVSFSPKGTPGLKEGRLQISQGGDGVKSLQLTGEAVAAKLDVPGNLVFDATAIGDSSTKQLVLHNSGIGPVSLSIPDVMSGANFSVVESNCANQLEAQGSCGVSFKFSPSVSGASALGLAQVVSGAGTFNVSLTGEGLLGLLSSSSGAGVAFPETLVTTSSAAKSVTITNSGTYPISQMTFSKPSGFIVSPGTCGSTLAVSESCTFTVVFSPDTAKAYAEFLKVAGSKGEALSFPLSGKGVVAEVHADDALTATYPVGRGSASGSTLKVRNSGSTPVTVTGYTVSNKVGNFSSAYALGCSAGKVLQPGDICGIWTSGDGATGTTHSGTVTVNTSAGAVVFNRTFQVVDISLDVKSYYPGINGGGVAVTITVSNASAVPFQVVAYNRGAVIGPSPAEWGYFSGGFSSNFTWGNSDCGAYLANGSKCTINILPNNPMYSWTYYTNYQLMGAYPKTDSGVVIGTVPQDNTAVWVGGPFQITYMAY